jgi:2-iminoacetate synthase
VYCAFRTRNREVRRRALSREEVANETLELVRQGRRRILLVAGESYPPEGPDYVLEAIDAVYAVRSGPGEIRRVNVNIAPLSLEEFRRLKEHRIGTYQVFQETCHRPTYEQVHLAGRKRDYGWRLTCMDRALEAGINDVGIGALFGLYDWRCEVLAILQHVAHLEQRHGVGPHTISVPRLEPAVGSEVARRPPHVVSDADFRKLVAILRLALPYTGIILSTRETAVLRREVLALGVSQISAGSRTNPGGYATPETPEEAQFRLGDHRSLDEVVRDVTSLGYIPSFCTACYRLGRTGRDFMDLARPGEIRGHCDPNALTTFLEYLLDYASDETRAMGEAAIEARLDELEAAERRRVTRLLDTVREGKRDVLV